MHQPGNLLVNFRPLNGQALNHKSWACSGKSKGKLKTSNNLDHEAPINKQDLDILAAFFPITPVKTIPISLLARGF